LATIQYQKRRKLGWARWLLFLIGKPIKVKESVLHTTPWLTRSMIALISLVSIAAWFSEGQEALFQLMVFQPKASGLQWYTGLVGCAMLHAGWAHLLGNMYFLWLFGRNVESRFGRRRMVGLFVIATALGAYLHSLVAEAPLVGASGGIFGILVMYALLFPRSRILWIPFFGLIARLIALRTEKMLGKRFLREGLPVRYFLLAYLGIQGFLLYEQVYADGTVSALGHLGGGLAGLVIFAGWKWKLLP
jgi:membrane associated rhomboid family serine protease